MTQLLDASTDFLHALIIDAPEPMIVTDERLHPLMQNAAADQMMGRHKGEGAAASLLQSVHPDDREVVVAAFHHARSDKSSRAITFRTRHPSSRWIPVEAVVRFVATPAGECGIVHLRDVTETESLKTRLRHAQKLTALGRLVVGLADELDRAVSSVRHHSHAIAGPTIVEAPFAVRAILKANAAANAVVLQLRAFADTVPITQERVDIHGLLLSLRRSLAEELWVDVVPEATRTVVRVERDLLWQGLWNLLLALHAQFELTPLTIKSANLNLGPWEANATVSNVADYLAIAVGHVPWTVGAATPGDLFEPQATTPLSTAVLLALVLLRDAAAAAGGFVEIVGEDLASITRATVYLPVE